MHGVSAFQVLYTSMEKRKQRASTLSMFDTVKKYSEIQPPASAIAELGSFRMVLAGCSNASSHIRSEVHFSLEIRYPLSHDGKAFRAKLVLVDSGLF